jgi:prephenate dehydrogenase
MDAELSRSAARWQVTSALAFCPPFPVLSRFAILPEMLAKVSQLTVLSPGLLGSSVARAVRARKMAERIVVWAHRAERRKELVGQPWCDEVCETPEQAVKGASLVVLAAPVDAILPLLRSVAPGLRHGAIVTDVGSVKAPIAREGHVAVGSHAYFVGSHPMAGSEKTSWEHGTATFFEGRACFVTPLPETARVASEAVADFWRRLGMEVTILGPEKHDEIVAHISHLPMVLASALCSLLASKDPSWGSYAGGGLRDTTRVAGSDPRIWRPILEQNSEQVLRALRGYQDELKLLDAAITGGDWGKVTAILERARAFRDGIRK